MTWCQLATLWIESAPWLNYVNTHRCAGSFWSFGAATFWSHPRKTFLSCSENTPTASVFFQWSKWSLRISSVSTPKISSRYISFMDKGMEFLPISARKSCLFNFSRYSIITNLSRDLLKDFKIGTTRYSSWNYPTKKWELLAALPGFPAFPPLPPVGPLSPGSPLTDLQRYIRLWLVQALEVLSGFWEVTQMLQMLWAGWGG